MISRLSLFRLACAAAALAALAGPASAGAFYANAADGVEGAELVSADYARLEQGDETTRFAAVSGDGRYVAMQTRSRNFFADDDPDPAGEYRAGGIFRFDLQTRALEKVADGDLFRESDNEFLRRGAANPSISADGRYVAFSTAQQLVPADADSAVDVYVRDMTKAEGEAGAFKLVSARDGGETPASFAAPQSPSPSGNPGAEVSPGVAISADGTRVAFRTDAESDLPAQPGLSTPAGQIFVRDLATQTTTLVTATRNPGTGAMTAQPAGGALGAALSADGSTVAWTGKNAAAQTHFLGGENTDPSFNFYLWRRAPFGPIQATRRITGLADPDDPVCRQMEEANPGLVTNFDPGGTGPCFGPLTDQEATRSDIGSQLPALSGDGFKVAYLTGAGPRPLVQSGPGLDLYLTDMSPGPSRKTANIELTRDGTSGDTATSSPLSSVAMSSDGSHLAITTSRTQFTLPALQLVGTARAVPGPPELYVVDLQSRTLERVTHSISGGDVDGGVQDGVTLSADGSRVAFSSFAGNLFRGDANQRADAFVATRLPQPSGAGPGGGGGGGGASSVKEDRAGPRVSVRAKAKAGGVIVLTISVPTAGAIDAVATARTGKPPKTQELAARKTRARGKGSFNVVMRAAPRFRAALKRGQKLHAQVRVTFTPAAGGKRLRASTALDFSGD
jgi:Tol biopolymer transport system component